MLFDLKCNLKSFSEVATDFLLVWVSLLVIVLLVVVLLLLLLLFVSDVVGLCESEYLLSTVFMAVGWYDSQCRIRSEIKRCCR